MPTWINVILAVIALCIIWYSGCGFGWYAREYKIDRDIVNSTLANKVFIRLLLCLACMAFMIYLAVV